MIKILIKTATALNFLSSNLILFTSSGSGLVKELRQKFDNVFFYPSVSVVNILFSEFTKNASALLVFYSFKKDAEHRMFSSFPSKLLEYMAVGLPIVIIAPPESSLGKWALQNDWPLYIDKDDKEVIKKVVSSLKNKEVWDNCILKCKTLTEGVFNPELIHKQFVTSLFS